MGEFASAVVGGLVGAVVTGLFSLRIMRVSLKHASKQAAQAEEERERVRRADADERERVRRADRLRALYADYIKRANALVGQATMLPIALTEAERGRPQYLQQLQLDDHINTADLDAALSLEGETDRAVRSAFGSLHNDYLTFLLHATREDGELRMPDEEYIERIEAMRERAATLTSLAQQRLDSLEARTG